MPDTISASSSRSPYARFVLGILAMLVLASALVAYDWWKAMPVSSQPVYVGGQSCVACHQAEHSLWTGSHHDLAMDLATEETVLGDFNNVQLEHYGITSTMFRKEGLFFVNHRGP